MLVVRCGSSRDADGVHHGFDEFAPSRPWSPRNPSRSAGSDPIESEAFHDEGSRSMIMCSLACYWFVNPCLARIPGGQSQVKKVPSEVSYGRSSPSLG